MPRDQKLRRKLGDWLPDHLVSGRTSTIHPRYSPPLALPSVVTCPVMPAVAVQVFSAPCLGTEALVERLAVFEHLPVSHRMAGEARTGRQIALEGANHALDIAFALGLLRRRKFDLDIKGLKQTDRTVVLAVKSLPLSVLILRRTPQARIALRTSAPTADPACPNAQMFMPQSAPDGCPTRVHACAAIAAPADRPPRSPLLHPSLRRRHRLPRRLRRCPHDPASRNAGLLR